MSWDAHVESMIQHGACQAAICGLDGSVWAQRGLDGIRSDEVLNLISCLKSGGGPITFGGIGCITLKGIPGECITAKAKSVDPVVGGERRSLYQCVQGKKCIYVVGVQGEDERAKAMCLEDRFNYLTKYGED